MDVDNIFKNHIYSLLKGKYCSMEKMMRLKKIISSISDFKEPIINTPSNNVKQFVSFQWDVKDRHFVIVYYPDSQRFEYTYFHEAFQRQNETCFVNWMGEEKTESDYKALSEMLHQFYGYLETGHPEDNAQAYKICFDIYGDKINTNLLKEDWEDYCCFIESPTFDDVIEFLNKHNMKVVNK